MKWQPGSLGMKKHRHLTETVRKGGLPIALLLTCFASCADLEDIELDRCGNRVLDPGEDCDGHDAGATPCAAPGAVHACRFTCTFSSPDAATACPAGYRCGLGDVCSKPSNTFELVDSPLVDQGGDAFAVADFDGDRLNDVAIVSGTEAEMSLTFMSGLAPIVSTSVPVEPTNRLAVGRIDSDDRPDIALGAEAAIVSLGSVLVQQQHRARRPRSGGGQRLPARRAARRARG